MVKWYLLIYLFLEVLVTIQIGSSIGGLNVFVEILVTGFLGVVILYNFKNSIAQSMMELMQAKIDVKELVSHNLLSFLGAILLIMPGMVSDFIGIILQLKFITAPLGNLYKGPERRRYKQTFQGDNRRNELHAEFEKTTKREDDVIDVEIIESTSTKH